MMSFLESLENTNLATWLRDATTVLAYATVLAVHTFGLIFLVGISTGIALRLLGVAPGLPLAPLGRFFRFVWLGFWASAVSGVLLLIIDARKFLTMPDFYIKLLAIAGAVAILRSLQTNVFGDPARVDTRVVPMKDKVLASTLLLLWAVAVTAGRVTAYDGFIQRQTAGAALVLAVVILGARYLATRVLGGNKSARQAV